MPNPQLTKEQLVKANDLLADVRQKLQALAGDDPALLFAYRRKVWKELGYDERSKPAGRKRLKAAKWKGQNGLCAECGLDLALAYSELDRFEAAGGYTVENTELVHAKCHHARQAANRYA